MWERAYPKKVEHGDAFVVPIKFSYDSYLVTGPKTRIEYSSLNYLLVRKDSTGKIYINWITHLPDKS